MSTEPVACDAGCEKATLRTLHAKIREALARTQTLASELRNTRYTLDAELFGPVPKDTGETENCKPVDSIEVLLKELHQQIDGATEQLRAINAMIGE